MPLPMNCVRRCSGVQCQLEMLEDLGLTPDQLNYAVGIHDDMAELEQMIEELLYFARWIER